MCDDTATGPRASGSDELEEYHGAQPVHDPVLMRGEHDGPIPDPGLPEHLPRPTDVDPAMERRAERQVSAMFIVSRRQATPVSFAAATLIPARVACFINSVAAYVLPLFILVPAINTRGAESPKKDFGVMAASAMFRICPSSSETNPITSN